MDDLKRRTAELAAKAERRLVAPPAAAISTGEAGTVRAEARAALDAVAGQARGQTAPPVAAEQAPAARPSIGDRVGVTTLGIDGTLVALHDHDAEVDVLGKRLRVKFADLRLVSRARVNAPPERVRVELQVHAREPGPTDLNVIGCTVDEALARAEKFLDEALLADQRTVRVIHGHGTGQLRRAIASFLKEHPQVARFALAPPEHGGGGVTVVELKE